MTLTPASAQVSEHDLSETWRTSSFCQYGLLYASRLYLARRQKCRPREENSSPPQTHGLRGVSGLTVMADGAVRPSRVDHV